MRILLFALSVFAAAACSRTTTQLLLHLESDLPLDEVSQFSVEAIADDGERDSTTFDRTGQPQTLGIVPPNGDVGQGLTILLRTIGRNQIISRRRLTSFARDRAIHLFVCVSDRCATSTASCTPSFAAFAEFENVDALTDASAPIDFADGCVPRTPKPEDLDAGMIEDAPDDRPDRMIEDRPEDQPDVLDAGDPDDGTISTPADTGVPEPPDPCLGWWDTGWTRRRRLVIDNSSLGAPLANFPALIALDNTRVDPNDVQPLGEDLRFVAADHTTRLDHEIESFGPGSDGNVWVRIPRIPSSTATFSIFMYYRNATAQDGQVPQDVWLGDYRAVWHMRESPAGAAPQILDSTAFNNDATANGGIPATARTTGAIGDAITFDGNNDYLSVPPSVALDLQNRSFTIELWSNLTTLGGDQTMIGFHSQEFMNRSLHLRVQNDARLQFGYWGDDLVSPPIAVANVWQYSVFAYDASTDRSRILVDGIEVISGSQGAFDGWNPEIAIGRWRSADTQNFGGLIDEVRVSSVVRPNVWYEAQRRSMTDTGFVGFGPEESCE